jgi:glyoxylase-like metal-dependent hydrolase (beta-lactamase superfamily II)
MLQIKTFVFNPFQENTYVAYDETSQCVILDPGCYFEQEQQELASFIKENKLEPKYLIHTHGHIDHALGSDFIKETYKIQAVMHKDDLEVFRRISDFGMNIGLVVNQPSDPEKFVEEGQTIEFGNSVFDIYHVPGHSPGSIALHNRKENIVFAGDVLFKLGIGRTDLFGGDHITLIESIQNKLLTLDGETIVYPGHGETTTIEEEKSENPLLNY